MVETKDKIYFSFKYIDEFGQASSLEKDMNICVLEDTYTVDLLLEQFKCFLLSAGFLNSQIDDIQIFTKEE